MQKDSRFFDDLAKMASSAAGTFTQLTREIEAMVTAQVEKLLSRMNLVTREEFEALRAMVAQSRLEQEKLNVKIEALLKEKESRE